MHACHQAISLWMEALDMRVGVDSVGNLRGLHGSGEHPRLLMGSHLDTVPRAGVYDGVLGVCRASMRLSTTWKSKRRGSLTRGMMVSID